MSVIEAVGLTKRFGHFVAVDSLDLSVESGECYAFLGRNGAGKSTTARMLLDFLRPSSGEVKVLGGRGSDPAVRERIGYLPGDLNLPGTMTGMEAVRYFGSLGRAPDPKYVDELIERFGMNRERPFHQMSTGNRRKVGLILAFMGKPDLLILDEPTNGLDPILQDTFRDLLGEHKSQGATVWITSHVMSDVEHVADRVGLIDQGRLAQQLAMADLRRQTTGDIQLTFPTAPDASAFSGLSRVSAVHVTGNELSLHVDGAVTEVLARAAELGATGIRTHQRQLEDIFRTTYAGKEAGR